MYIFIKKTIFFFLIVSLIFWGAEIIITQGLRQSKLEPFGDWNTINQGKLDVDLVVSGSSKACAHLDPLILDSVLSLKSYNLGVNAYLFQMQKYKYDFFKSKNRVPKIILQIVSNGTLGHRKDLYASRQFLPYINNPIIQEATKGYKGLNYADYYLPFVRYFGEQETMLEGLCAFLGMGDSSITTYKGYIQRNLSWDNSFNRFKKIYPNGRNAEIKEDVVSLFENFIEERTKEGIKVILVYPPTYLESQAYITNRTQVINLYQSIAKKFNIPFWDYSALSIASDSTYFYNSQHLNKKGADFFSKIVASDIKNNIDYLR